MICKERGVSGQSQYFFFSPSDSFLEHNYGIINCGHFYCSFGYQVRREEGNAFPLFILINAGELHLNYENEHYVGKKGNILLIDCSKPHRYYVETECEFLYFHFAGKCAYDVTSSLIRQNASPVFRISGFDHLHRRLDYVLSGLYASKSVGDVELSCLAYRCLCTLQAEDDIFTVEDRHSNDAVNRTITYIKEHLDHKFTLSELAGNVNMSDYYFAHIFKKETGISPVEYASQTKINYAKSILKTSESSISEISDLLGYSSNASFINAFKKRVGISPSRFRKN